MTVFSMARSRLGVVGFALLTLVFVVPEARATDGGAIDVALSAHLTAIDLALARHDVGAATTALQEAYQVALGSRHWQGMIAYGDAALRVADALGTRKPGVEKARRAYLLAVYRARAERSVDGALAAAHSFAALGDREVANGCLAMAQRLTRTDAERERVRSMAARVSERLLAEAPDF
jgi:hypothetical protein